MVVKYINRKEDTYYLHQGKTKTGNPKYFFSNKKDNDLVNTLPQCYEIYENPNAQVFLRIISPKIITDEELSIVKNGVKKYSKLKDFKIDVEKNKIIIFFPDQCMDELKDDLVSMAKKFNPDNPNIEEDLEKKLRQYIRYSPKLRFVLTDKINREFKCEAHRILGSKDDWILVSSSCDLAKLVEKIRMVPGQALTF